MSKKNVSQSQIQKFRSCPRAYEYSYRLKKQGMMWDHEVFNVGRTVHDVIDNYYKYHYKTNTTQNDILIVVYELLRQEWKKLILEENPKDVAIGLKKAYTCLCNFAEFEASNINNLLPVKPLTEIKIYSNQFVGIIDYLELSKPLALDWKTPKGPGLGYGAKLQAVMYKELIKASFDIDLKTFTFYFLYPNVKRYVKFDKTTALIYEDIINYRDSILQSWKTGVFPKKPRTPGTCGSCAFRYYCSGV